MTMVRKGFDSSVIRIFDFTTKIQNMFLNEGVFLSHRYRVVSDVAVSTTDEIESHCLVKIMGIHP